MELYGLKCREQDIPIIREVWEENVYERHAKVKKGDFVVDAGAHIGSFAAKVSDRARKVICFEPEPSNLELLKVNLESYSNFGVCGKALWSRTGKERLYHHKFNVGGSSLIPLPGDVVDYFFEVETVRLDEAVSEKIDFIKMDIEGCEVEALLGSTEVLHRWRPVLVVETHPVYPLERWWKRFCNILDFNFYELVNLTSAEDMWQRRVITAFPKKVKFFDGLPCQPSAT